MVKALSNALIKIDPAATFPVTVRGVVVPAIVVVPKPVVLELFSVVNDAGKVLLSSVVVVTTVVPLPGNVANVPDEAGIEIAVELPDPVIVLLPILVVPVDVSVVNDGFELIATVPVATIGFGVSTKLLSDELIADTDPPPDSVPITTWLLLFNANPTNVPVPAATELSISVPPTVAACRDVAPGDTVSAPNDPDPPLLALIVPLTVRFPLTNSFPLTVSPPAIVSPAPTATLPVTCRFPWTKLAPDDAGMKT